jgi:hypothetical protein
MEAQRLIELDDSGDNDEANIAAGLMIRAAMLVDKVVEKEWKDK